MAFKREDLLKFSKSTDLVIKVIEDDSSADTEVKILHLVLPVKAVGSNPTPDGKEMAVNGTKVYVAADDIEKMLAGLNEEDGKLVYKGSMHLDVSKPKMRIVNGQPTVTAPPKIWLTATKFNRRGAALQTDTRNSLNNVMNSFFAKGEVDLTAETGISASGEAGEEREGPKEAAAAGQKATVVANKPTTP